MCFLKEVRSRSTGMPSRSIQHARAESTSAFLWMYKSNWISESSTPQHLCSQPRTESNHYRVRVGELKLGARSPGLGLAPSAQYRVAPMAHIMSPTWIRPRASRAASSWIVATRARQRACSFGAPHRAAASRRSVWRWRCGFASPACRSQSERVAFAIEISARISRYERPCFLRSIARSRATRLARLYARPSSWGQVSKPHCTAITSISIRASRGNFATCTVVRAGGSSRK